VPRAVRGRLAWFPGPDEAREIADGVVVVGSGGLIERVGEASALLPDLPPGTPVDDWRPCLVVPGLVDAHAHYPQTRVIASYGTQLLDWLHRYTFPEEQRYADPAHAAAGASFFLGELLRNGTTTAAVYCTVHPQSAEAFFAEAGRRRLRMVAGKVMMDRDAPPGLLDTAERGYRESLELADRWHGVGRLGYAVTPRFAVTSTEAQLEAAGALLRDRPGLWLQTHLAENRAEIATVAERFPWARDYADVYDRFGLLGPRSVLGHCIHLSARERSRLAATGSVAAFCPTSNLFIGSGLFDLAATRDAGVRTALATDVGGGTSYSMLRTAAEAYKVLQLQGQNLHAYAAFHLMTRGNALALGLADRIGALEPGLEADLAVLDPAATPAMAHRMERGDDGDDLAAALFALVTLGDDRAVRATYVLGERAAV
jgi:guanine deaminase